MVLNSLLKTVTRQRRSCDLNPGPSAPESGMLTTRLLSHPMLSKVFTKNCSDVEVGSEKKNRNGNARRNN